MTKLTVLQDHPISMGAGAIYPYTDELMGLCARKSRYDGEYSMARVIGTGENRRIMVPRNMAPGVGGMDLRASGLSVKFKSSFKPRNPEQKRVIDETVERLGYGMNFMMEAPTGFGKTWCAMDVIARIGLKTIIVVTKEDIRDQWIAAAEALLGLSVGKGIGLIQGDTFNVAGQSVVIAMIQSLSKDGRYPEHAFKDFGLAIWDECFHPSHDLLTARGWVPVAEVTMDDLVAQVDPQTKALSFAHPEKVIKKPFEGSLVNLLGQKLDLMATPNHQHLTYWDGIEPRKIEYRDFNPKSRGQTLYAPTPGASTALTFREQMEFAFQADGHLVRQRCDGLWYVKFSFRRQRKVARLESMLAGSVYEWTSNVNSRGDTVIRVWLDWKPSKGLAWVTPTKGSGWYVSALDELAEWDGWRTATGIHYESDHPNCEVVQLIALLAGRVATVHKVRGRFRVNAWTGALRDSKSITKVEVSYSGDVYCVRMPHGTVVARRNGKVAVTGNCHRVAADNFSQSAYRIPAKLRLGISATPDRKDGKEEVLYAHIGRIRVRTEATPMTPRIIRQESPWDCPMRRKRNEDGTIDLVPIDHSAGAATHVVKLLANHHGRNTLIAKFVAAAFKKGRKVLVQSDLKDHLDTLVPLICKQGVPMAEIAFYVGGMKSGARENAKTKSVIMATYAMTAEATDIPTLDTLVMCTPKSDVRQIVGRVIRFLDDKKEPVVFDIVDSSSPIFNGYAKARLKWYKSIGASVGGFGKKNGTSN